MSPVNDGVSVRLQGEKVEIGCEARGGDGRAALDVPEGGSHDASAGVRDAFNGGQGSTISLELTAFDTQHYQDLIRTRAATIRRLVTALKPALGLRNALDAGCGVGFFAQTLTELG